MNGRHAAEQPAQDLEAAVAADADQPVEMQLAQALDHLGRADLLAAVAHREGERIAAIGGAEEGAALARQHGVEPRRIERLGSDRAVQQPVRTVADADCLPAITVMRPQRHRTNGGVEAGAVTAAGEDADALGHGNLRG